MCGFFVLRVFTVYVRNGKHHEKCVLERVLDTTFMAEAVIDLSRIVPEGADFVYFSLEGDNADFYGGDFCCVTDMPNEVNMALVFCTYKREKYMLRNRRALLRYLKSSTVFNSSNLHVYIVDNGKTLDKKRTDNAFVTLFPNDNTGGSGGFTRGYQEAVGSGRKHTHIIFADDDIRLDCNMLMRVYGLLRVRKKEYENLSVGGTMLRLSDFVTQHEAGAVWDGKRRESIGNGLDMTDRSNVFLTMEYPKPNYNAWWFFCFPSDWHQKHGYPLPFFVKSDDIEYCLRCADEIAVINGIAVWHEDFEDKYAGYQEYYIKRNELIMTAIHNEEPDAKYQLRKLYLSVMKQCVFQRYFIAGLIFRAYNDFLRGYDRFMKTDAEELNKQLMKRCPKLLPDKELEKQGVRFDDDKYLYASIQDEDLKKQMMTLNGALIPSVFYPKDTEKLFVCDLAKCRPVNFYRHKRVLHYDPKSRRGYVTRQSRIKLFFNLLRLAFFSLKFLIRYPVARRSYRRADMPDLPSAGTDSPNIEKSK